MLALEGLKVEVEESSGEKDGEMGRGEDTMGEEVIGVKDAVDRKIGEGLGDKELELGLNSSTGDDSSTDDTELLRTR